MIRRLPDPEYMAFPFRITEKGAKVSKRADHVREQIEQVLFTSPGERVFRPEFGAGVQQLLFEPNSSALWELTQRRLAASLAEVLQGEVDPQTLTIQVEGEGETLKLLVSYRLATVNQGENHCFPVAGGKTDGNP